MRWCTRTCCFRVGFMCCMSYAWCWTWEERLTVLKTSQRNWAFLRHIWSLYNSARIFGLINIFLSIGSCTCSFFRANCATIIIAQVRQLWLAENQAWIVQIAPVIILVRVWCANFCKWCPGPMLCILSRLQILDIFQTRGGDFLVTNCGCSRSSFLIGDTECFADQ